MPITKIQPFNLDSTANYTFGTVTATNFVGNGSQLTGIVSGTTVPTVTAITYPGDDTAADVAGGQTITITGTGFASGAAVIVNGVTASVVSVVSTTTITFTAPALIAGSYVVYVVNTNGTTALAVPGIQYSGTPTWTTAAGSLGTVAKQVSFTANVVATGDAPITYSVYAGALPAGLTLTANTGVVSGTTPNVASDTTYNFTIRSTDAQQQDTDRAFSITVTPVPGLSSGNPASSISQLRANGITTDGAYWFSTTKQPTAFRAYVRFNYIDGGDWALLLKVHNQGDLPSGSPFWTNTTLSNSTDFNLTSGTWSKYATWNGIEFTRLMMVMTQGGTAKIPPIMIFSASRTFAEAITLAGGAGAYSGYNNVVKATSTDPAIGASASYLTMTMKSGTAFTDPNGLEDIIQAYGIGMWANNAMQSTTAEGFASTGRAGAWIGCPLDEGSHTFNADTNTGADSGFGFGFAAGNTPKTGSAGYAEWTSASTNTLPGYVWVR